MTAAHGLHRTDPTSRGLWIDSHGSWVPRVLCGTHHRAHRFQRPCDGPLLRGPVASSNDTSHVLCFGEMGAEEPKQVGAEAAPEPPPAAEAVKDVAEEKASVPPPAEEKPDDSKALAIVEKVEDPPAEKSSGGSTERDAVLARLETEKRLSLIKAWEENEKTKAENK
ncbi:hypothetical protein GW17_00028280 [Ensete ventricosum]|nr:hypothetical protein GW17_00028280 [Ensete ventricosum]